MRAVHPSTVAREISVPPQTSVHLCIPDDCAGYADELPRRALEWSDGAPLPRRGDVLYLSNTSWAVTLVIHERLSRDFTRVEVWLEYAGQARHRRDARVPVQ